MIKVYIGMECREPILSVGIAKSGYIALSLERRRIRRTGNVEGSSFQPSYYSDSSGFQPIVPSGEMCPPSLQYEALPRRACYVSL
jgi:hypothetical protein